MTRLPRCIRWTSHKKTTKFTGAPHILHFEGLLSADFPPGLTDVRFIATSVACPWRMRNSTRQTLLHALHTAENVVQSCEQPSKRWPYAKGTRGYNGNNTYGSWSAPEFVPFLRRKLTGTKSQVDVQSRESESQQDRYWNGLKSRSTRNEEQYWKTRIRTPDAIHTNVEGFFQQLTTALVTATPQRHGGNTSKRHQTSGHDGTPTSTLAPRLGFSWHIIAIRWNHGTFTNAYETSN